MLAPVMVLLVLPLQGLLPIIAYSQIPYLSTPNQEQQGSQSQPSETVQGTSGDDTGGCFRDMKRWKKKHGYGMRWIAESAFSSIKRTFGE